VGDATQYPINISSCSTQSLSLILTLVLSINQKTLEYQDFLALKTYNPNKLQHPSTDVNLFNKIHASQA
jgi:hypothetical protein